MSNIIQDLKSLAVSLDRLTILENNPRKGDVKAVVKSYETFGQRKPIVVRKTGVNKAGEPVGEILAGNHQYQAAKNLGWTEIAVVWVEDDDSTAAAYAIADNKIATMGEWDEKNLYSTLSKLDDNLLEATGFSIEDLQDITEEGMNAYFEAETFAKDLFEKSEKTETVNNADTTESIAERKETYDKRENRMIVIDYPLKQYVEVNKMINEYRKESQSESNSEAVLKLLKKYKNF
jgi:hypothetical protein